MQSTGLHGASAPGSLDMPSNTMVPVVPVLNHRKLQLVSLATLIIRHMKDRLEATFGSR